MATLQQKRLARELVKDLETGTRRNAGTVLENVGYSKKVATHKPKEILESKGVRQALAELGFTVDGADSVVKKIMYKSKREDMKLRAADMVYKRLGAYEDTKQGANKTNILVLTTETAQRYNAQSPQDTSDSRP